MHDSFILQKTQACSIPSLTMSGITSSEITADKPALGIVPTKNSGQNMDSGQIKQEGICVCSRKVFFTK